MSKQIDFNIEIDSFLNSINDKFEYKYGGLKVTAKKKFYQDPQSIDITEITFCVLTQMQTSIRSLSVETKINGVSELYYLDRYYQWKSLSAKCIVSVTTPIVVRYNYHSGKTFELRSLRGYHSYSIKRNGNRVSITYFIDHAALHPKWNFINDVMVSDAVTELPVGFEYQIDFLLFETDSLIEEFPVTPGRFPSAMEACFCITDHCDFDSTEKLELFLNGDSNDNGWLGKGLRMTKGAFSLASKPWHRPEVVSLEDKEYSIAIKKLYEDGSEIAPHGLQDSASLEINPNLFSSTLSRFSAEWHPGTWIDHGKYFEYSYLKGGDKNDYMLLEELEKSGIKLLWSYHDISSDASSGLNLIAPKSNDAITITKIILYHLFALRIPIALHFFRSFLRKRCSKSRVAFVVLQIISMIKTLLYTKNPKVHSWNYIRAQIKRLVESLRSDSFNRMSYYSRREELELAPAIYPERGVPINHVKENEHLLFCTNEVLHIGDVYSKKSLDRLICEKGLHIGHTYLLNTIPYLNGLLKKQNGSFVIDPKWSRFVKYFQNTVNTGVLWNPVVSDLGEWTRAMQFVSIIPMNSSSVKIMNDYSQKINDFTLLIPEAIPLDAITWGGRAPKGSKQLEGIIAIFGDLNANSNCIVSWN